MTTSTVSLAEVPLFTRLRGARRVLIAGAGGGFDVYAGVPLYLALRAQGLEVHLANLSFSRLPDSGAEEVCPSLFRVRAGLGRRSSYEPEKWLCEWLAARGDPDPVVWTFDRVGVRHVRRGYEWLAESLQLDAVVLVDGGTDILMRGDEEGLGTPEEDLTSLAAIASLADVPTLALACVGFGVDAYHGVSHARFLENVAALDEAGGFWGAFSLPRASPEVAGYLDLVRAVHAAHPAELSLVNGSIAAAIEGRFGNHQFSPRTARTELFINPLMALCWSFDLRAVAARAYALPELADTETMADVAWVIDAVAARLPTRRRLPIPV